jgi:hypothetical protein
VGTVFAGAAVGTSSVGNTDGRGGGANNSTVPTTILKATAPFKINEAYHRQSRFVGCAFDRFGMISSKFCKVDYSTIRNENKF